MRELRATGPEPGGVMGTTVEHLEALEHIGVRFRFREYAPGAVEFVATWPRRPMCAHAGRVLEKARGYFAADPNFKAALERVYVLRGHQTRH